MATTYIPMPQVSLPHSTLKNVTPPRTFFGPGSGIPPNWGVWDFGDGTVGIAYYDKWDMPNADEPVIYSVDTVGGYSLPPGVSLVSTGDGHSARLDGTPTTAGAYTFRLRATNSVGFSTKDFTVTIDAPSGGGGTHRFVYTD